jgi:hypothetical protein
LQDPPKSTQIGIFGEKICHLATLIYKQLIATLEYQILKSIASYHLKGTNLEIYATIHIFLKRKQTA